MDALYVGAWCGVVYGLYRYLIFRLLVDPERLKPEIKILLDLPILIFTFFVVSFAANNSIFDSEHIYIKTLNIIMLCASIVLVWALTYIGLRALLTKDLGHLEETLRKR